MLMQIISEYQTDVLTVLADAKTLKRIKKGLLFNLNPVGSVKN